jgi:DNA mismatch endonuclease (patch repair protein)
MLPGFVNNNRSNSRRGEGRFGRSSLPRSSSWRMAEHSCTFASLAAVSSLRVSTSVLLSGGLATKSKSGTRRVDPVRSRTMASVRSFGNRSTEMAMVSVLRELRASGWRRHVALPGRPDFSWKSAHIALFVDGCFWHGCPRCYREPRTNKAFWRNKLRQNRTRDRRVRSLLRRLGWRTIRIWECQVMNASTKRRVMRLLGCPHV